MRTIQIAKASIPEGYEEVAQTEVMQEFDKAWIIDGFYRDVTKYDYGMPVEGMYCVIRPKECASVIRLSTMFRQVGLQL